MLGFVLGGAGSGKTHYIKEQIKSLIQHNEHKVIVLVPEQYSFETEKAMLKLLGPHQVHKVDVMSFTRLGDMAFRAFGGSSIPKLDDSGRHLFMSLALEEVKEHLQFYVSRSEELIPLMLSMSAELKVCAVSPTVLIETADHAENDTLKQKMKEVGLILSAYDALVAQSYLDPLDDLQRLKITFTEHAFFTDYHIYIDSFKGFTQQEFDLIELMMIQAQQVTVSLTCDTLDSGTGADVFARVRHTAHVLIRLARQNHVQICAPVMLQFGIRFASEALKQAERQLFRPIQTPVHLEPQCISLYCGDTIYSEAAYIGAAIRNLVMDEGYRYEDFTIISRTLDSYHSILGAALEQYEIPFFMDTPRSVFSEPLMCLVLSALQVLKSGFSSDELFNYLKTGLAGLTAYEISLLENYTFLWNLSGKQWMMEWTANADGFVEQQTSEQQKRLKEINQLRERAVKPLLTLQKRIQEGNGFIFAKAIYQLLEDLKVSVSLQKLSHQLEQLGCLEEAEQQARLWNILMEILDQCASVLEREVLTVQRFAELLRLMILSYDVAGIPQTLDHVTIGTADRMRPAQPKVVFVIGAVQGEFPAVPTSGSIFSETERRTFVDLGISLSDTVEERVIEEQYLAYTAVTSASHKLYITWHCADASGEVKTPSVIVSEIRKIFPFLQTQTEKSIEKTWLACTAESAFFMMAKEYRSPSKLQSTLKALFLQRNGYRERLAALDYACKKHVHRFVHVDYAKKLFQNKSISATQIEQYYLCSFQYFCRYGLNIRERRVAEIDQLEYGSFIHYLLEKIFALYGASEICKMTEAVLQESIKILISEYIDLKLGGNKDKTPRFRFVFRRIADSAQTIIRHIAKELAQSQFQPIGYELSLTEGGDIEPLQVVLPDGGSVYVEGKVDSTDVMEKDGVRYIRVIDYKTGRKEFKLGDVMHGINMQMLIYLAAFIQSGRYQPAGVLYMPASRPVISVPRSARPDTVEKEINKKLRMNGIVINDTNIICGMEEEADGIYIPVALKNGAPQSKESILSADEMNCILHYIEYLIGNMAQRLQQGYVEANPLQGDYDGCQYCSYFAVCQHEKDDRHNTQICLKKDKMIEWLMENGGERNEQSVDAGAAKCD